MYINLRAAIFLSYLCIDKFKQAGAKPFYLAGILYVWLVFGGYAIVKLLF